MKKILFTLSIALLLSSCLKEAQHTEFKPNGFQVQLLFEHDGIKMYRFYDGGETHYFTDKGKTISQKIHRDGKGNTYIHTENID